MFIPVQVSRQNIVKYTPEFTQAILNGRSRKGKTNPAFHGFNGPGYLCGGILDILRLIYNLTVKPPALILFDIPSKQII